MKETITHCSLADVTLAASREFRSTPSGEAERRRLGLWDRPCDAQPTGAYAKPGETFTITVFGDPPAALTLEALVGTYGYAGFITDKEEEPRAYGLSSGGKDILDPEGGLVWIRAVSDSTPAGASSVRIEITGSGVQRVPVYRQGETDPADWPQMLADSEMQHSRSPVQLVGKHIVLTAWRGSALTHRTQNPDELLNAWERIQQIQDSVSDLDGRTPRDTRTPLWTLASECVDGVPNASNYRISLPNSWGYDSHMLTTKGLNSSWGVWHELGHMHQQISWTPDVLNEVSVNIYALAQQRAVGDRSRAAESDEDAQKYLARPDSEKDLTKEGYFVRLVMLEQLRLAFGEGYYPDFHKEARANGNSDLFQGDENYRRYFMVTASKVAGKDLTDFFVAWGMKPGTEIREAIAALALPKPDRDLTKIRLPSYSAGLGEEIVQVPGTETEDGNAQYWVFSGGRYAKVAVGADGSNRIVVSWRDVTKGNWPSLGGRTQVDAVLPIPGTGTEYYVFSGDQYAKIRIVGTTDTQVQDWRDISDYWPSLEGRPAGIAAVVPVPGSDGQYYVFSGPQYARIELVGTADTQVQDWRVITGNWPSLDGRSTIDSAMRVPGSATSTSARYWVFSDSEYATIELRGTKDTNVRYWTPKGTDWPTLRP